MGRHAAPSAQPKGWTSSVSAIPAKVQHGVINSHRELRPYAWAVSGLSGLCRGDDVRWTIELDAAITADEGLKDVPSTLT